MYTTKFIIEVTVDHNSPCELVYDNVILVNLDCPAVSDVKLIGGETNEDVKPQEPSSFRRDVMEKLNVST